MYTVTDRGAAVRELQKYLGPIDGERSVTPSGIYGEETEAAVRDLQKDTVLPETGRVDRKTFREIYRRYSTEMKLRELRRSYGVKNPFPICVGDFGEHVRRLNVMLIYMMDKYCKPHDVRGGGVFTQAGLLAVGVLRLVYRLPDRECVDELFYMYLYMDYISARGFENMLDFHE